MQRTELRLRVLELVHIHSRPTAENLARAKEYLDFIGEPEAESSEKELPQRILTQGGSKNKKVGNSNILD